MGHGGPAETPDFSDETVQPNAARMYDYYLGGAANFAPDREAARQVIEVFPQVRQWARANRWFLRRVVSYLCEQGVDQFLDLGSGIPTVGSVHEIALAHNPHARVAYVDHESVAVSYSRHLLADHPGVAVLQADIRRPQQVVTAPEVADLIDFDRPVAVLAFAILHALSDDDRPREILAGYRRACVPGSYLAISHGVITTLTDEQVEAFVAAYRNTPTPATFRTVTQVAELFDGYELVAPGLVLLDQWRPEEPVSAEAAAENNCYAGVGRLPGPASDA